MISEKLWRGHARLRLPLAIPVRCPQSAPQPLARFASMISAKLRRGHALSAEHDLGPRLPESSVWHVLKRCTGLMWGVRGSTFDDEFMELCSQKMKAAAPTTFIWHRYLQDSKEAVRAGLRNPPPQPLARDSISMT